MQLTEMNVLLPRRADRAISAGVRLSTFARLLILVLIASCISLSGVAQHSTASRVGDLQIGGGLVLGYSNYNLSDMYLVGGSLYTSFDFRRHWGGEFDFHEAKPTDDSTVYERSYEVGPRYFVNLGRTVPYAKVMLGRGVFNFRNSVANVAYNEYSLGGGADFHLLRSMNIRADYEYQSWIGFPLTNLHPSLATIGVAYHFHE